MSVTAASRSSTKPTQWQPSHARVDWPGRSRQLGRDFSIDLDVGANIHLSVVVEGEFGRGASRSHDIIGPGVIHTFRMGAGPGVRISEPVYRKQPNDQRSKWKKRQPPATYTLSE